MQDRARIHVQAGAGGDGCLSFRREAHVPRGGPDGGDGGRGGDVILVADPSLRDLATYRRSSHHKSGRGGHGQGALRHGRDGETLELKVPPGTEAIVEADGARHDLVRPGQRAVVARGGLGGRGNKRFATPTRQTPRFAERGLPGEETWLTLQLKLLADVGLVGLPNAGKSSLLSRLTRAHPKVADYPFTTLQPHLGVVSYAGQELVVADIPGLIEGASEGKGLGHQFLRHIERARVIVVLVDLASVDGRSPDEQQRILVDELRRYRPELAGRPRVAVGSKLDLVDPEAAAGGTDELDELKVLAEAAGVELVISAVTGAGVEPLVQRLTRLVTEARAAQPRPRKWVEHRPVPDGVRVERDPDGSWRVAGRAAVRAVALSDLTDVEALAYAQGRLRRLGVDRALARAGAHDGDRVRIGDFEFDYSQD